MEVIFSRLQFTILKGIGCNFEFLITSSSYFYIKLLFNKIWKVKTKIHKVFSDA